MSYNNWKITITKQLEIYNIIIHNIITLMEIL